MALKPVKKAWNPSTWASLRPFGVGLQHPNNYAELLRAVQESSDNLPYALKVLLNGTCDGCALGTHGVQDWTVEGIHLCNVRLRLLRLNTMPAMDTRALHHDIPSLLSKTSAELRNLGRIPYPMMRQAGEEHFKRVSWAEAVQYIAQKLKNTDPNNMGFYLTSRGLPNETYYMAQKAVRAMGSNNIDNAARVCHAPSTDALKKAIGYAATTCSYQDLIGTDLLVFVGSNPALNQPVLMKYLYKAKKAGTKIVTVNPYLEPGMKHYWVPSNPESALFGTKISDAHYGVRAKGDVAFFTGVLKHIIAQGWQNQQFIAERTEGFAELRASVEQTPWDVLEQSSGMTSQQMLKFALTLKENPRAVLVWGMGLTHNTDGENMVRSLVNVGLVMGYIGKEGCGLMPIRGHSGVQGGAEMGAYAYYYPAGADINPQNAAKLAAQYGFDIPSQQGLTTGQMLDAAAQGNMQVLWSVGGNFLEVMPSAAESQKALEAVDVRIHQDIFVTKQMLLPAKEAVLILPATTRYEISGGVTETSTERRIIFSPEITGFRIPEARPEGEVFLQVARELRPELAAQLSFKNMQAVREEIANIVPFYAGIEKLYKKGDSLQYGGRLLCTERFNTPSGKAQLAPLPLPNQSIPEGAFHIMTRRGKQFNTMVYEQYDGMTGSHRQSVFISHADAQQKGIRKGQKVRVYNNLGSFEGEAFPCKMQRGILQIHYPEGNSLFDPHKRSPIVDIPAYKESHAFLEPL